MNPMMGCLTVDAGRAVKALGWATAAALLLRPGAWAQAGRRVGAAAAVQGSIDALLPGKAVGHVVASGEPVVMGERITSKPDSRMQIVLLDETVFTVGPKSTIMIDEFVYDPATGAGKVTADITKGVFRFVTGRVAKTNPSSMKVKLPNATIGIRGTIAAGRVGEGGRAQVALLGPGARNNVFGEKTGGIDVIASSCDGEGRQGRSCVRELFKPGWGVDIAADGTMEEPRSMAQEIEAMARSLSTQAGDGKGGGKLKGDKGGGGGGGDAADAAASAAAGAGKPSVSQSKPEARGESGSGSGGGASQASSGGESVSSMSGAETASGGESLSVTVEAAAATGGASTDLTASAIQDVAMLAGLEEAGPVPDGPSSWDDLQRFPTGTARFADTGTLYQFLDGGLPCAGSGPSGECVGAWSYDVTLDLAQRTVMIDGTMDTTGDGGNISVGSSPTQMTFDDFYSGGSNPVQIYYTDFAGNANWMVDVYNANGKPAQYANANAYYDDGVGNEAIAEQELTTPKQ